MSAVIFSLFEIYKRFIQYSFHFSGKASRQEYWTILATHIFISWIFLTIINLSDSGHWITEVFTIYVFATWIPKMSLSIRRLHDTGKSGLWYLISFLPLLGPVILFILCSKDTKKEARPWASPPAAGRFCDKALYRRMAILAERFYVIGRTFLWHKICRNIQGSEKSGGKSVPGLLVSDFFHQISYQKNPRSFLLEEVTPS